MRNQYVIPLLVVILENTQNLSKRQLFCRPHMQGLAFKDKGRSFSEKDWYYLQAQTDMPFHYLKLVV